MTQATANMSVAVKLTTALMLIIVTGTLAGAAYERSAGLLAVGTFLAVVSVVCYLLAPVRYELSEGWLTVFLRVGRRRFGPVVMCAALSDVDTPRHILWSLRMIGNGGVFAGTGIYWHRALGVFRAYVTSARRADMVLIATPSQKIVISPQDPQSFVGDCSSGAGCATPPLHQIPQGRGRCDG